MSEKQLNDIEERLARIESRLPGVPTLIIDLIWTMWIGFAVAIMWMERN